MQAKAKEVLSCHQGQRIILAKAFHIVKNRVIEIVAESGLNSGQKGLITHQKPYVICINIVLCILTLTAFRFSSFIFRSIQQLKQREQFVFLKVLF